MSQTQDIVEKEVEKPRVVLRPKRPVKKPTIVEVDSEIYRTIQSFVESSRKSIYPWNTGIETPSGVVIFEKIGNWKLVVGKNVAILYTGKRRYAIILTYYDFGKYEINVSGTTFRSTDRDFDVRTIYIRPNKELPFWRHISLDEVMSAIWDYVEVEEVEEAPQAPQEQIQTQAQ